MKCTRCGKKIKMDDANFCPFCGGELEEEEELAGYTRAAYFSISGDDEFQEEWENIKKLDAKQFLEWLRGKPKARYVYRFHGNWTVGKGTSFCSRFNRIICKHEVAPVIGNSGTVTAKRTKLTYPMLKEIGENAFITKEDCELAIKEITENAQ